MINTFITKGLKLLWERLDLIDLTISRK